MRYTILVSVLAITFGVSFGQEMIVGQVFNLQTREPIPFAHIVSAKLGTTTNLDGKFRIPAHAGDTLLITHVNYEPLRVMITSDSMNIYLRPGDVLLDEIIIGLLPSEDQFKKRLLESRVAPTKEEAAATQTMHLAKILFLSGYTPEMSSYDNYKEYSRDPQGVSIFSSDPSKGLIKSIQNISRYHSLFDSSFGISPPDSVLAPLKLNKSEN